ncbi:hypothetical protein [Pseudochrobactrum saccharolyticum]|uniref:hypothetical protein n=1 Tax=Pseudochrobactrum saccharolyticum TaxID=354352 RepID=UPI00274D2CA7|nr:hypothetical protein [Pseudochrobactrum saccharolyticum]MDP8249275.1 hypothetical protein [Pseudochrobactrum saccharolyticum]
MNDEMKFTIISAYLCGALYLSGVFVAALVLGNTAAALWAIAGAAASYVANLAAVFRSIGLVRFGLSLTASIAALVVSGIAGLILIAGV